MRQHHVLGDGVSELVRQIEIAQEHLRDGTQRVLGPGREPVDDGVVHQPGEVAASRAKGIAHGGHREHDVQVIPAPIHVVPPARLLGLSETLGANLIPHAAHHALLLVIRVQRGHHPGGEHVVHQLEKTLVRDVVIREEEHNLFIFHADAGVERLEIFAKHRLVVPSREGNLEDAASGGVRSEPRQTLLTRAAHADEQSVALIETDDAVDAGEMFERVLEEDEVHRLVFRVVQLENRVEHGFDVDVGLDVLVQAQRLGFLVAVLVEAEFLGGVEVIAEEDRITEDLLLRELVLLQHKLVHLLNHHRLVLLGDEPVVQDAKCLVAPETDEIALGLELVRRRAQYPLVDAREIAEVEDVMEARRRWRQFLEDVIVQVQGDIREIPRRVLNLVAQLADVRAQDAAVDGAQVVRARELDLERVEERDEARVHGVARAPRRSHRGNVEKVLHLLPVELLPAIVQTLLLDESLQQRDGLLGTVQIHLGHVQIVEEEHQSLPHRGSVGILGSFLDDVLDATLNVHRRRSAGEVHPEQYVLLDVEVREILGDGDRLGRAAISHEEYGFARAAEAIEEPAAAHGVHGGDEDGGELCLRLNLQRFHHGLPGEPLLAVNVEAVLVQRRLGKLGCGESLTVEAVVARRSLDELVHQVAVVKALLLNHCRAHRPH